MSSKLQPDQWKYGFDGIGVLLSVHPTYVEEFHKEFAEGASIGVHVFTRAFYKMLCEVDGQIRKRQHLISCNLEYCDTLDSKGERIVTRLKIPNQNCIRNL